MKRISLVFLALISLWLSPDTVQAGENTLSFVIAPPPVGYPVFEKGVSDQTLGGNFIYVTSKLMNTSFQLFGAMIFGNWQYCVTNKFALSGNYGASFLLGNKYDLMMIQLPYQFNLAYQIDLTEDVSLFLLGGAGGDLGVTFMTVEVPQFVPNVIVIDPTTVITKIFTGKITGGLQANIGLGQFIFSPFGLYTYTAGTYMTEQTSAMSFNYPSSAGAIDGYSTTVLGFDLFYKPAGVSLSSMTHFRPDTTLVSIALKWLLSRN
ncbi:MAG: hypothetical protein N2442_11915 [Spirochaetes bacterium]|nr:hypothetical protein [Spirochaetota bacterium]